MEPVAARHGAAAAAAAGTGAAGLAALRERIGRAHVPRGRRGESLVLATWNIRELGKSPRRADSLRYIAEVLRAFDLTVVVELREDLRDMRAVMAHLGPRYGMLFSECVRDAGGNRERIAFVFDRDVVSFTGLASHLVPPREKHGDEYLSRVSWWRPPYVASFRSGPMDFVVAAAHIRWGDAMGPRARESEMLADWAVEYARGEHAVDRDVLLVGDFNVPSVRSEAFGVLARRGFEVPRALVGVHGTDPSRAARRRRRGFADDRRRVWGLPVERGAAGPAKELLDGREAPRVRRAHILRAASGTTRSSRCRGRGAWC